MHGSEKKYQVMPDLTEEEYAALKADIAEHGVLVPVETDELGNILDGYHRARACHELGISEYPRVVRSGLTEEQKRQHARRLNLTRRHLSQEQKRELVCQQIKETPQFSNRRLARLLGVSHPMVSIVRYELESLGQVERFTTSLGADGKAYPRGTQGNYEEYECWHDEVREAVHAIIRAVCDTLGERLETASDIPSVLAIRNAAAACETFGIEVKLRAERALGKLLASEASHCILHMRGLNERESDALERVCRLVWPQEEFNFRACTESDLEVAYKTN